MEKLALVDLSEVLVPFETVRTYTGKVVYCNKALSGGLEDAELLSRYSYVSAYGNSDAATACDRRIFFAERYGGDGILNNGGGARCGFDGVFQVKGIGLNRLLGSRSPDIDGNSHANGLLCLNIALYESIWAEVIQRALPCGAVSTVAIIDLEVEFEELKMPQPRALLVRLPAVRPAHFIRAMYFKEKKYDALSEDAKRVKAAVRRLVSYLPVENIDHESDFLCERLKRGVVELARRYAKQFATARSKRIYHSNVSASNITIDGAWLDLSRSSVFSERLWWDGFDLSDFTGEHGPAINSIREMCFYLSKYDVVSLEESKNIFEEAVLVFGSEYEKSLFLCNAVQLGFPSCVIEELSGDPFFLDFSKKLKKVLAKDTYATSSVVAGSWVGYEHWIARFYMQLLRGVCNDEITDLSWVCEDHLLLSQTFLAYRALFELVASKARVMGVGRKCLAAYIAINATRLNRCNAVLFELSDEIAEAMRNAVRAGDVSRYGALFEKCTLASSQAFKYDEGLRVAFWEDETRLISFDAVTGLFLVACKNNKFMVEAGYSEMKKRVSDLDTVLCFYEHIEDLLYGD